MPTNSFSVGIPNYLVCRTRYLYTSKLKWTYLTTRSLTCSENSMPHGRGNQMTGKLIESSRNGYMTKIKDYLGSDLQHF